MKQYFVDGSKIHDIQTMCDAFGNAVDAPAGYFGRCIVTFDDCFFGYVHFEKPCEFIWQNARVARQALDAKSLATHWALFEDCEFYGNYAKKMMERGRRGEKTLFDDVIEQIQSVGERNQCHFVKLTIQE